MLGPDNRRTGLRKNDYGTGSTITADNGEKWDSHEIDIDSARLEAETRFFHSIFGRIRKLYAEIYTFWNEFS